MRLGIDIGGTKINIGLLDENHQLLGNKKILVSDVNVLTESLQAAIKELSAECSIDTKNILSCGVGVPGTVSADGKRLLKAPNISILSEHVAADIEKALHIPTLLVQDSRAAAWGEYLCGAGAGAKTVICFTLGTGLGTGIVMDGKIFSGALGNAGELGHVPTVKNGRPCGCGKKGCLEKYCAGRGLDMTASELLGEGKTAYDLFKAAKHGNSNASAQIQQAVQQLGNTIVSAINLLSPDCVLFSGGLIEQKELYLSPLIEYIKEHCYSSGKLPRLEVAALGENAPMIGAALLFQSYDNLPVKQEPLLSASIMCADALNLGKSLEEIKDAGIQYIHCDIMDNHFVPNLMLPMELLSQLHQHTTIPFDYHLMAENPETIIEKLLIKDGDIISVHYESTTHLQLLLEMIHKKGAKAAVALNPATSVFVLSEVLAELDMVLLMTVNPGFSGQKIVPGSFAKIQRMRKMLDENGYSSMPIEVDGNCSFENVPKMYNAGANIFVVGTSSVFRKDLSIKEGTKMLLQTMK